LQLILIQVLVEPILVMISTRQGVPFIYSVLPVVLDILVVSDRGLRPL
jgi:hypothetical protein